MKGNIKNLRDKKEMEGSLGSRVASTGDNGFPAVQKR